jgi:hypothetical protein
LPQELDMTKVVKFDKVDNNFRITIEVDFSRSMLEMENEIQDALNQAGQVLTAGALEHLDTDGSPIRLGSLQLTTKGKTGKDYETPYGKVTVNRHVYQTKDGGKIFCPLDYEARIIGTSTPRFANIISYKFSNSSVSGVSKDLLVGNRRVISNDFVFEISALVANIITEKESVWNYEMPRFDEEPATIGLSLDGTCVNIRQDGWRQVMVGTLSLYDNKGERLFTQYLGESPENGKERFYNRFSKAVEEMRHRFSGAQVVGVADGAKDNWSYLSKFTNELCLDFYHASEYVFRVSKAAFSDESERKTWVESRLHDLKHTQNFAQVLIAEMQEMRSEWKLSSNSKDEIKSCQTYFENNKERMPYSENISKKFPIGSGVVEAGCKVLVKERLCGSGMRWSLDGCHDILQLRSLAITDGRWEQFWKKVDRFGIAAA